MAIPTHPGAAAALAPLFVGWREICLECIAGTSAFQASLSDITFHRKTIMKRALITGVTGQDGSYLAEFLLEKGYEVHGIKRRSTNFNTDRVDGIYSDTHQRGNKFFLHFGDMANSSSLWHLLQEVQPDEVYNLAAQSHVRVSFDIPEYTADITGTGT